MVTVPIYSREEKMDRTPPFYKVPHRLETAEEISEAMRLDFLSIGGGYLPMLDLAGKGRRPVIPPAMAGAKPCVRKDFYRIDDNKIREYNIEYREIANLQLINNFSAIENRIPWVVSLAQHRDIFSVLRSFPAPLQNCWNIDSVSGPATAYASVRALWKFLRLEILSYTQSKRMVHTDVGQLKQLMVASALFLPANEDVLQALKQSVRGETRQALFQNALAELLFVRIPGLLEKLVSVEPSMIRRKLFAKIAKLGLTGKQRLCLYGYFQDNVTSRELLPALNRVDTIAQKLIIDTRSKERLHDYIESLENTINRFRTLYEEWFLDRELIQMRQLFKSGDIMRYKINSWTTLMKTFILITSLEFYPTKDWMDLAKSSVSMDCSGSELGVNHLLTPNFFNIRIFRNARWIGNIYMLDFTEKTGCIIVDRIQIPRGVNAEYIQFFSHLSEVLENMFEDIPYEAILLPLSISNHQSIQKAFNLFRRRLPRRKITLRSKYGRHFESLSRPRNFHILCSKEHMQHCLVASCEKGAG